LVFEPLKSFEAFVLFLPSVAASIGHLPERYRTALEGFFFFAFAKGEETWKSRDKGRLKTSRRGFGILVLSIEHRAAAEFPACFCQIRLHGCGECVETLS
jgi:hypothetical protein